MKLFLLAIGGRDRASSRLRVWDHVEALRDAGHQVCVDSIVAEGAAANDLRFIGRLIAKYPGWLYRFFAADAVLLQETMILWPALLFKDLGKRRRLVFDFSDPVDRIGRRPWMRLVRRKLMQLISRRADTVVAENGRYLPAMLSRGSDARKFYGPVDVSRYQEARTRRYEGHARPIRIGWTGSPGTFHFIAPLLAEIDELGRNTPIELVLIGIQRVDYTFQHATLTLVPWSEASEFELVPSFDLGIFRIDESENAKWRGAGKLFIYMASSVPFIASDSGIARDVMDEAECGFRVGTGLDAWATGLRAAVDRLASDGRREAQQSLRFAEREFSYQRYRQHLGDVLVPSRRESRDI